MSFSDWSNNKKKENEIKESEETRNKTSFSAWSNNKKSVNVNDDYISAFVADANSFFDRAGKDYSNIGYSNVSASYSTNLTTWSDIETRATAISAWLERNKDNVDDDYYNNLSQVIRTVRSNGSSLIESFKSSNDFITQNFNSDDEYNKWYKGYKEQQDILNSEDLDYYVQEGSKVTNPSWEDTFAPFELFGWTPFGDGEDIANMVTFAEANNEKAMGQAANAVRGGGSTDEKTQLVNLINTEMEDNEKAIYNYYIGKGEIEKANEYLNNLKDTFVQRQAGKIASQMDDNALEYVMAAVAGLDQFATGVKNLGNFITGGDAEPTSAIQYAWAEASSNNEGVHKVLTDLMNTTAHMLPSILVGSVTGGLGGAATLGASAVGNGYAEMKQLGYDEWQARGYGLLVGASETALQYVLGGISKLGGKVSNNVVSKFVSSLDNALARTAIQLGGNMASEGLEEAIQTVVEPAFKAWVTGEDYDAPELEEVLYSALLGSLSAGMLEGVPTIAGTIHSNYQTYKQMGGMSNKDAVKAFWENKKISDVKNAYKEGKQNVSKATGEYINKALAIDPENTHAQRMKARLDNGKNVSSYQINRIVEANESALYSQDTVKIKSATEARLTELGEKGDVGKLADALAKKASGEKLSLSEKNLIKNSTYGQRVENEYSLSNIESGKYTSKWAEDIGMELIRTKAYNKGLYDYSTEQAGVAVASEESPVTENPTEKETATEAKFEVSTDGRTKIGNMEVSIKEIASVKNGEVILRLEDGSTVNAGDVEYGSSEEGLLYENVADLNLNPATANAFVKGYDPSMSVQQYALGFREAYRYGEYGYPVKEMSAKGFSAMLSESQKSLAYNLGKTDAKYKIDAKIASTGAIKAGKDSQKTSKKGKLYNNLKPTNETQRASLKALGVLAEALNIDIYTFESPTDAKGRRLGENGSYDPVTRTLRIDLYAGADGKGTMLFTAAHELTHHIRNTLPAKFKAFADFLFEQYGEKGVSVSELIAKKINDLEGNNRTKGMTEEEIHDLAYEEVVADACESFLADGDAVAKIAELKAKDKTLWQTIKDFITKLVARIKEAYEGLTPDSVAGNRVAEMLDSAEKLKAMWSEMLVETSEVESAVTEVIESDAKPISSDEIITDGAVVTDGKGKKYSIRSMKHDISDGQMFRDLMNHCGFTKAQVGELRRQLEDLVEYMNPYRDIVDLNETYGRDGRRYSPYKPNSDPLYTISLDFSTQCSKRLLTQYVIEQLQLRENRPMSPEEQMAIRDMLKEYGKVEKGLQVACVMCYVEAARLKAPKQIQKWIDDPATQMRNFFADKNPEFSKYIKEKQADFKESRGYDRNATKKDMSAKDVKALNQIRPRLRSQYNPSVEEMAIIETASNLPNSTYLTAGNLADLSETHPDIYKAYTAFIRTATRSKALETDEPYYYGDSTRDNGNGIIVSDSFIEAVNRENGMRFSSWSDWRIQHLLDWITAVIDNSVRGAAMHGYTKYGDEVRVLGKTGMMFNMSGVAGTQTGLNEDGSLNFSETESMDYDEAIALREEFPETAGLQCIGVGIDHIYALLRSDVIDYVIPYHTSGLNATLRRMGDIYGWKDFTQTQHATEDKSIKKEDAVDPEHWHQEPVFSEFFVGYDTKLGGIEAMRKSAENYKRMCKERGLKPKFLEFAEEPNYWKLLIDRKMVNQKTNTLIRQKAVTPNFDFGVIKGIVDKYVANYDSGLEQRAFNHIVENWDNIPKRIRDLKKQGTTKAKSTKKAVDKLTNQTVAVQPKGVDASDGVKYSDRVTDKETLDFLNKQLEDGEVTEVYRAMAVDEDGNLYPPMAGYVRMNGKKVINGDPSVIGKWEQSTESIQWDSVDEEFLIGNGFKHFDNPTKDYPNGRFERDNTIFYKNKKGEWKAKFHLDKDNGSTVDAAYAPYIHTSLSVLNDQFTSAYTRENLVVVKGYVPNSEVYGVNGKRYQANFADKPVGKTKWHSGVVAAQMPETRTVILSRYFMPIEIVDDSVVAQKTKEMMKGNDIEIPYNVVTPSQRRAMEAIGIRIGEARGLKDAPKKADVKYSDRVLMGSLFSGGGTLEAGLAYQMLDKEFGVEYDGKIASVYADNHGDHIQVGRVEDFDISKYDDIFYLHASPVCHNFSKAKHGAKELQMDIDSAKATAQHLETAMPQVFTVENAPGYRKSQSLQIITNKLTELGYKWDVDVYNSADYGSATSRNRVILRAVKDGELPAKPTKQERTNSWDKVTRDLWNTLPKSYLRPSFISAIENTKNLPILDANGKVNVNKPLLILTTTSGHMVTYCWEGEICPTLTTKCGEAKLVMPDGNIYAVTPEFMGRIQGLPDDYKYPKAKTRAFTIIGNGIPTHLTKAVVGGVLDSAYEQTHNGKVLYSDRNTATAPTFYSYMGKVVDGIKTEKVGANGVVPYLKGKGVKAEEIKWSGIEAFLEGKKSVTKAELQEFVAGSQLNIEEKLGEGGAKITLEPSAYAAFGEDSWSVMRGGELLDTYTWHEESGLYESDETGGGFKTKERVLEYFKEKYGSGDTRWEKYKLEGGTNYRELVFKMPNSSYSNSAMSIHWGVDAKGVLAHARIQDFTTTDGKKMLFVEEIQSDWHNAGQKYGYEGEDTESTLAAKDYKTIESMLRLLRIKGFMEGDEVKVAEELAALNVYARALKTFDVRIERTHFGGDPSEPLVYVMWWDDDANTVEEDVADFKESIESDLLHIRDNDLIDFAHAEIAPDAPFRTNYHEYVLKRLLRMAAEEGYDSIGWTPAEIQDERWADYQAHEEGKGKSGNLIGYTIEYDQDMPKFLRKYGKKWGATVGKTALPSLKQRFSFYDVNRQEEYKSFVEWQNTVERDLKAQGAPMRNLRYESDDNYWIAYDKISGVEYDRAEIRKTSESVWSMDIPDSMKDSVLHEGQVLYSDRYSEGLSEADKATANKVISGLKIHAQSSRYGIGSFGAYTEERMDREIAYSSSDTVPDYARSYITWVEPIDFIYATTTSEKTRAILKEEAGDLDIEKLRAETQPIHLIVDFENKKVVGHEGRHRMLALQKAGVRKVAVVIDARYDDRHNTKPIEMMHLMGQSFGDYGHGVDFFLHDMLPLSKRYAEVAKELFTNDPKNGVRFSERDSDSVSNRSLLANALEDVAQNDIERNKLKEYKGKIALIESEQAKLADVRKRANDIRFTKGRTAEETKRMKDLDFEANQIANRINTYDKQLLNLESTKALKGVLEREKQMAYKRAEKKGKEALEAYRERATNTQRELLTRYQESRKKNVEGRKQTAMRHKIKDVVNELNQYLLKGTKEKHVPIELQKAVAEALDAVNMDTVGAEERIAKKRAEMMRAKTPEAVERLAKEIEHIQEMGGNMANKISRLKTSYDSIINSDDPIIANSHDEVIANTIDKVIEVVGDTPLRDMSLYQLEAVYDMYRMVLHSIRTANKAFKAEKGEEISVLANTVISDLDGKKRNPLSLANTNFAWNNLKPVYAFERIGSNTLTKLFNAVRAGEDVWARDMSEAQAFREEQSKKHKFDSWDFEKKYHFTTHRGTPFELDLGEMMSIYAFAKDEHSKGHLIGEGFVFDPKKEVVESVKGKIKVKVNLEDATAYNLSEEIVENIKKTLFSIPGAKEFVDAMQDYLSTTMGEKGNEVSLELYQIKLFKNKNYFPLKVAPQYMAVAKEKAQGDVKIKNKGFTKDRKDGARNPIVLSSFMDVWASHVNEMSMYHAFTLPLEDFYRVFNYKTPRMEGYAPMSVNASLENAYGKGATQYIDQLLKDLNGGARVDHTTGIINKLTGLFKKSAVFLSLSVVVQQPSAIARATALVDTKYFIGKKVTKAKHKETWAEVKQYAPVAIIKEMGYFDTGMGQSSVDWLKGEKTWKDKFDDLASKLPALADEYTWCAIWNAVKRETLYTHKDLKPNSEEFLNAVGERFTEVITKTQVYDSVLARSANMRSKDTGMKMVTAFMGEPTTSINMLQDALTQGKRGNKRYARKAIGGVVSSMILNSILVSLVYAGRDDDEDKTYAEKYVGTLTEELIDSINPLTLIPFVKDIVSIVQGYDVERSDMAVITDIINAWNNLDSDNRAAYRKVEDFAGAIASIFGLPVKNVMRDARGIYNTVNSFINGEQTTGAGIKDSILEAVTGNEKSNGQQLYEAIISGDTAQIDRVKGRFKDQKAIDSAIRTALRDNDSRIEQAAEARYNGDIAEYMRIAKEIIAEGNFSQDNIVSAINSEITALKKGEGTSESTTSSNKVTSIYKVDDYYTAIVGRDQATAYAVKEDLIKTDVANGKDREEAEADFNSKFASHLRELYEDGEITYYKAEEMLVNYGGKSEEEASSKVQYWEFKKNYPDYDLSEEAVKKYYDEVEPYGIGVDVYYDYSKQRAKCKGVDANGDGKTDSGSVKSEVMQVINSLPLTYQQKDALYYLNGWSASTIWEAPWH